MAAIELIPLPPMHEPMFVMGDPIEVYPSGADVRHWPDMEFMAAPMPDIPGLPSTDAPKLPPCGDTEVIPPTVIPMLFMLYVDAIGLMFPPAMLALLIDVSG